MRDFPEFFKLFLHIVVYFDDFEKKNTFGAINWALFEEDERICYTEMIFCEKMFEKISLKTFKKNSLKMFKKKFIENVYKKFHWISIRII